MLLGLATGETKAPAVCPTRRWAEIPKNEKEDRQMPQQPGKKKSPAKKTGKKQKKTPVQTPPESKK
jgi:hypothetical protein